MKMAEKKKASVSKTTAKKKVTKGDTYMCEVCGLGITVDTVCGCVDVCDIVCCGVPMKEKKTRAKAAKK
jgi:hypothetical protein